MTLVSYLLSRKTLKIFISLKFIIEVELNGTLFVLTSYHFQQSPLLSFEKAVQETIPKALKNRIFEFYHLVYSIIITEDDQHLN